MKQNEYLIEIATDSLTSIMNDRKFYMEQCEVFAEELNQASTRDKRTTQELRERTEAHQALRNALHAMIGVTTIALTDTQLIEQVIAAFQYERNRGTNGAPSALAEIDRPVIDHTTPWSSTTEKQVTIDKSIENASAVLNRFLPGPGPNVAEQTQTMPAVDDPAAVVHSGPVNVAGITGRRWRLDHDPFPPAGESIGAVAVIDGQYEDVFVLDGGHPDGVIMYYCSRTNVLLDADDLIERYGILYEVIPVEQGAIAQ